MDEFVVLLVVAFVVIGAMMLIGTPLAEWSEGNWGAVDGEEDGDSNFRTIASFDIGKVGLSQSEVSRTARFGSFVLGQTQDELLKEMPSVKTSQGYFGSDVKEFIIDVDGNVLNNLKDVKISFGIEESNLYGNLVLKWNEKTYFDKLANLRRYDVYVSPEDVKGSNTLVISAGGPGLYFWAATYYELKPFTVSAEYGPEKFMSFKVYPNEIEAWNKGTLRFYTTKGQSGEITVKLNGKEIFRESDPQHLVTKEFEYSDIGNYIKIGDNILSFKSDSVFNVDDVEFEISIAGGSVTKERDFNVTDSDISLLDSGKEGVITFTVDSIYRNGVLNIEINGNQLSVQTVRSGENTIEFDKNDVLEGINTLKFSGTGSWDISGVEVKIHK